MINRRDFFKASMKYGFTTAAVATAGVYFLLKL